jgi:hypothetical protein
MNFAVSAVSASVSSAVGRVRRVRCDQKAGASTKNKAGLPNKKFSISATYCGSTPCNKSHTFQNIPLFEPLHWKSKLPLNIYLNVSSFIVIILLFSDKKFGFISSSISIVHDSDTRVWLPATLLLCLLLASNRKSVFFCRKTTLLLSHRNGVTADTVARLVLRIDLSFRSATN